MDKLFPTFHLPGVLSFLTVRPLDILDIILVAYIIYRIFHLMKGTRAVQIMFGLLVLIAIAIVAQLYQLPGTSWVISSLKTVWVVAFVILFQPEIRNAMTQLGRNRFLGIFLKGEVRAIEEVIKVCQALLVRGYGAIIVLEKNDGLKNYTATGVELNAHLTEQLLVSLFVPDGPLHDGAVIIRGETVVAAGCTLPITKDQNYSGEHGMRHRAAVGLSEETDAVAVVVSEEKQSISIARYGKLIELKNIQELREKLNRALHTKAGPAEMKENTPGDINSKEN
jgi:diadenylate cyclase